MCRRSAPTFRSCRELVHGKPLVYLDSANTSQKPSSVLEAMDDYYRHANANIHRATHLLSERATKAYEGTRAKAARFINAPDEKSIVLTTGTTDGINLVAQTYGRMVLRPGRRGPAVVARAPLEHRAVADPLRADGRDAAGGADQRARRDRARRLSTRCCPERTKIVAISHVSNALGTINPVRAMIEAAHAHGAVVLIDGAQAVPHLVVDVTALDCDFYVFSSHKMFGPTGTGVLYGRRALLEAMPPYRGGGDMIASVTFEKTTYNAVPYKFEAGTPNIAGVVGLGAAIDYLGAIDRAAALSRTRTACSPMRTERLREIPGTRVDRRSAREDRRAVVRDGRRASARRRDDSRPRGHCGPHRPALRAAGHGSLRHPGDDSRVARAFTTRARTSTPSIDFAPPRPRGVRLMSDLTDLYQEVILDHNRRPRNFRAIDEASRTQEGYNPLCGDRLTLYVKLDGDRISDVSFQGTGCAISKASASLMTER